LIFGQTNVQIVHYWSALKKMGMDIYFRKEMKENTDVDFSACGQICTF